jgi:hypothetical protein
MAAATAVNESKLVINVDAWIFAGPNKSLDGKENGVVFSREASVFSS